MRANRVVRHPVTSTLAYLAGSGRLVAVGLCAALATASHAAAQDRALAAEFEEVYRVGGVNAPEWAFFEDSLPASFDASGNLYVLDRTAGHVVIVDAGGGLVRTVGRKGEGPGELNLPLLLAVWRNGRFVVSDIGHGAYQVFGAGGELERFVKMAVGESPFAAMSGGNLAIKADPGGDALIAQGSPSFMGRLSGLMADMLGTDEPDQGERVDERGLERVNLAAEIISFTPVLRTWRAPREETAESIDPEDLLDPSAMVGMMDDARYFEPGLHWDLLPDGAIAYSDSSTYAVKIAEPEGPVRDVLRRPLVPQPVTPRIRSDMVEHALREMEESMNDPSAAESTAELAVLLPGFAEGLAESFREEIENREFHPEIPVVRGVRATWEGGLWIQRRGEEPWDDEGPIDVFGADREYVGTFAEGDIEMPAAFGPDGLVVFWEFDELDVPTIVVKRLQEAVR